MTFDDVPTDNSNNPVKSNGIYDALAGKQDTLTFDDVPTDNSNNPVKSNGIYDALAGKQDTLTYDNTPTQNSDNMVKSGGIWQYISNILSDFYPVGTVIASQNKSWTPNGKYPGTWTTLPANYVLWSTTVENNDAGDTISAGLPNIKGTYQFNLLAGGSGMNLSKSGAFNNSSGTKSQSAAGGGSAQSLNWASIDFKASNSSSIYKDSVSTVQPPAIKTIFWKRTS